MDREQVEPFFDEVELKVKQALRRYRVEHGLSDPSIYTRRDIGIKAKEEVYNGYDHGATNYEIQKAIEKVADPANNESRKEREASEFLTKIASKGFYGYLKLAKLLGMPRETFTVRTWYGQYLAKLVPLINPGGEVKVLEGTYTINSSILGKRSIRLNGTGKATILKLGDQVNDDIIKFVETAANTRVRSVVEDMKVDGNRSKNTSGNGVHFIYASDCFVERVEICEIAGDGVVIEPVGDKAAENNRLIGLDITKTSGYGVNFSARDNILAFSYVHNLDKAAVYINKASGGQNIIGNGLYGCYRGVEFESVVQAIDGVTTWYPLILGNYIDWNKREGMLLQDDIKRGHIALNRFYYNSAETDRTYDAILMTSPRGGWTSENLITGNRFFSERQNYAINTIAVPASASPNRILGNNTFRPMLLRGREALPNLYVPIRASGTTTKTDPGTTYVDPFGDMHTIVDFDNFTPIRGRIIAQCSGNEAGVGKGLAIWNVTDNVMIVEITWDGVVGAARIGSWADLFSSYWNQGQKKIAVYVKGSSATEDISFSTVALQVQYQ